MQCNNYSVLTFMAKLCGPKDDVLRGLHTALYINKLLFMHYCNSYTFLENKKLVGKYSLSGKLKLCEELTAYVHTGDFND